jgi:hypothetical protein
MLFDSFIRVMFDPDGIAMVLVDYGDPLWGEITLDGEQIVQEQGFVRAAGIRAIPRGNQRHTLGFELCRVETGLFEAFEARVNGMISLPKTGADILISLQAGQQWRISKCAVRNWGGSQDEFLTRERVDIVGGALSVDEGSYSPGSTWETLIWESIS